MKTNYKYAAIALLALGTIFTSCEKSDLAPGSPAASTRSLTPGDEEPEGLSVMGQWKLMRYEENGVDQTEQFRGYVFDFISGDKLTARKDNSVKNGRWSRGYQNSNNSRNKLYMDFGTLINFGDISDTWHIIELTQTKLELKRVYDSHNDYITFMR